MPKMKLKKGDKVIVIAGKNKGKSGKILAVDPKTNRVIIEGVNMMTKHVKPNRQQQGGQNGGIIHQEAPVHASNVMYVVGDRPTRIGYTMTGEKKVRIAKVTGEVID